MKTKLFKAAAVVVASAALWSAPAFAAPYFVGPQACQECHKAEFGVWENTKHAKSFRDLHRAPKANDILARATALQDKTGYRKPADGHATAGARRLLALAEQGTRIDKRLWTEIAKLTGANSNTTALVGTPEQVAEVFGDYYELGVSHFLIRGFDPLIDAIEYGRELIPLMRKLIAERQSTHGVAAQ